MNVEIRGINFVITLKVTISKLRTDKRLSNMTLTSIGGTYSIKYLLKYNITQQGSTVGEGYLKYILHVSIRVFNM